MSSVDVVLSVQTVSVTLEFAGAPGTPGAAGATGPAGPQGIPGDPGITVGNTAPVNPFVGELWVDTN